MTKREIYWERHGSKLSRKENADPDILYKGIVVVVRKGNRIVAAKSGHSLRMHLEILSEVKPNFSDKASRKKSS